MYPNLLDTLSVHAGRFVDWLSGKKTAIAAGFVATVDVLQYTDIAPIIPTQYQSSWTVLHPFLFAYLRLITRGPAFQNVTRL